MPPAKRRVRVDDYVGMFTGRGGLGDDVLETLATFALASEPGARLVLQRNPEGFSTQVTGPVYRGSSGTEGLPRLRSLRKQLNELMKEE